MSPSPLLRSLSPFTVAAAGTVLVLMASAVTIGADTMWLVAMGNHILEHGLSRGVPFAEADSSGWTNVPVLAEVVFAQLDRLGPLGLPIAQLLADAGALCLLAAAARRLGAGDRAIAIILVVTAAGALPALGVVRAQLLSLVPFALLLLLLRAEYERPSRRIWLLVPLTAIWGNLHGAVLAGVALAGVYLCFSRLRIEPLRAVLVGLATVSALWLNPAHLRTADYYLGVLGNEAARRGSELWAAPRIDRPFDVIMVLAAVGLGALALSKKRPLWEYLALIGLALATATAGRHGFWLLMFLSAPAASALAAVGATWGRTRAQPPEHSVFATALAVGFAITTFGLLSSRVDTFRNDEAVIAAVAATAPGQTVLAPEPLVESLAASGVRVWLSNPIDAFSPEDQAAYLDFVAGGGPMSDRALEAAECVVAKTGSQQAALAGTRGFGVAQRVAGFVVMMRP